MKKLTTIIAAFLLCQPVLKAQFTAEIDTVKNYQLDEIIIYSPKYYRNIFDIPVAASMLSGWVIENGKMENLTDISAFVPNFFMPDYGSKLTSPVYIRGV